MHGEVISFFMVTYWRFYTTYRLLPVLKESVVVIGSPGFGAFYDENDVGFENPENRKKMTLIRQGRRDSLFLDAIFKVPQSFESINNKEFSVRNPNITFHHILPGFVRTYALENQRFHPNIITLGRIFGYWFGLESDVYADVPVAKAVTLGGGLKLTQQWGWKVGLEKWAQDPEKRKALFEWALKRAQTAAQQSEVEKAVETKKSAK
jgi:hypothetical protein